MSAGIYNSGLLSTSTTSRPPRSQGWGEGVWGSCDGDVTPASAGALFMLSLAVAATLKRPIGGMARERDVGAREQRSAVSIAGVYFHACLGLVSHLEPSAGGWGVGGGISATIEKR